VWVSGDVTGGRDYHSLSEAEKKRVIKKALASDSDKVLSSRPVKVSFSPNEMPGRPKVRIDCDRCGERVMDAKHVIKGGKKLCHSCAEGAYYKEAR